MDGVDDEEKRKKHKILNGNTGIRALEGRRGAGDLYCKAYENRKVPPVDWLSRNR